MIAENFRSKVGIAREYRIENFSMNRARLAEVDRIARELFPVEEQPVTPRFFVETLLHAREALRTSARDDREVKGAVCIFVGREIAVACLA